MSELRNPTTERKQGKRGKSKQVFTERAVRRAGRACPDRILRICLDGTLELIPVIREAAEREQQKNDWAEVLTNAPDEERPA
jgi:hypothetical protein